LTETGGEIIHDDDKKRYPTQNNRSTNAYL
jgi:hypothetical protein